VGECARVEAMNRLKFRAYIPDEKRFMYCDESQGDYLATFFVVVQQIGQMSESKIIIEEWTGLTDIEEQDIYRGDILQVNEFRMSVVWDQAEAAYYIANLEGEQRERFTQAKAEQYKVISNTREYANFLG
jgi:hypothetical protein